MKIEPIEYQCRLACDWYNWRSCSKAQYDYLRELEEFHPGMYHVRELYLHPSNYKLEEPDE
jgi:hypothetical protein